MDEVDRVTHAADRRDRGAAEESAEPPAPERAEHQPAQHQGQRGAASLRVLAERHHRQHARDAERVVSARARPGGGCDAVVDPQIGDEHAREEVGAEGDEREREPRRGPRRHELAEAAGHHQGGEEGPPRARGAHRVRAREERREEVELHLDLERPGDGVDPAQLPVDEVVEVEHAGDVVREERRRGVAAGPHLQREEQRQDDQVGGLDPRDAAQVVRPERHGRAAAARVPREGEPEDEAAHHEEEPDADVAAGEQGTERARPERPGPRGEVLDEGAVEVEEHHRPDRQEAEAVDSRGCTRPPT